MKKTAKLLLLIFLLAIILFSLTYFREHFHLENLQEKLAGYGWYAPLIFISLYIVATVLFLPGSAITLAGGLLFGPWWGTLYSITGATIGASFAFLLARYIAADWVRQRSGKILGRLLKGVEREGWRFVAIVRLIPLFPFNILNYALGLTPVKFWHYVFASAVFMLPGCFAYTYVGSLGHHAISGRPRELITHGLIALGLVLLVAAIPWVVKQVRGNNIDTINNNDDEHSNG